ncbi:hypothetical protein [Pedobacter psychrodurus]|uniref:hypothetical protein n=1 Tax=Pedobacter psychrodurus TaxID=2530456 RepID=UPI00292F96C0|nr:hypothetical protein [Pedobacter psychrodurus]
MRLDLFQNVPSYIFHVIFFKGFYLKTDKLRLWFGLFLFIPESNGFAVGSNDYRKANDDLWITGNDGKYHGVSHFVRTNWQKTSVWGNSAKRAVWVAKNKM